MSSNFNAEDCANNMRKIVDDLSFPRLIGSKNEEKAVNYITTEFEKIGLRFQRIPFKATLFWAQNFLQYSMIISVICNLFLIFLSIFFPIYNIITIIIVLLLIHKELELIKRIDLPLRGKIYESVNLRGDIAPKLGYTQYIIFMAHHDSKSQPLTTFQRTALVTSSMLGILLALFFYFLVAIISILNEELSLIMLKIAHFLSIITILISIPLIFNKVQNKSPGAMDNASGVATLFALSKYFLNSPLSKTKLIFLITGAEETTTYGSRSIVHKFYDELYGNGIPGYVINFDMVGFKGSNVEYIKEWGFPKKNQVNKYLSEKIEDVAKEKHINVVGFWLPIGAMTDRVIFTNRGFQGIDFINKRAGMKTHTQNDSPDKFDENIAGKFIEIAIATAIKIDSSVDK